MTQDYTALDFYKTLYHTDSSGQLPNDLYLALFCPAFQSEFPQTIWDNNVEHALSKIKSLNRDVHMQVALSNKILPNNKRNNAQFVGEQCIAGLPALFADIDCYKIYPDYIPGTIPDEIRNILEIDDLKPTAYINSGGGIHVWWFFDKITMTPTPESRKSLSELLVRFATMLRSRVGSTPVKFDSVFDLARVLRVIGSYNYKSEPIRECKIIEFDPENLYMMEQFEDLCEIYTPAQFRQTHLDLVNEVKNNPTPINPAIEQSISNQAIIPKPEPIDIIHETLDIRLIVLSDEEELELTDKIESLCEADDDFQKAYSCYGLTRFDKQVDISSILQKLAYRAAAAAEFNLIFSDTEIFYIFKRFIAKYGVNDEHYNDRKRITRIETFVKPSIKKARALASEHIANNELKELSEKPKESITKSDLKKIYDTIKRLHGFSLLSFTKISDGSYEILTESGLVTVPNVETLGDQKKLQLKFMECINKTFQPIKSNSYRHTLNMMFSIMQSRLANPENDFNQQIRSFLIDYILQSSDLDQTSEDLTIPEKDIKTKNWRIIIEVFCKWLKSIHGITISMPLLSKAMLSIEAERAHSRYRGVKRHHWILPESLTTEIDLILTERDLQMSQHS